MDIEIRRMPAMFRITAALRSGGLLAIVLGTLSGIPLLAGAATENPVARCRAIADDSARLRCFDQIDRVDSVPVVPAAPPAQPAATVTPPPAAPPPAVVASPPPSAGDFGARALPRQAPDEPRELSARLVGTLDGVFRGLSLPLDNGQTWVVIDDREFEYVGGGSQVTLDRNLVGTYWMKILDGGPRFKVRRVK